MGALLVNDPGRVDESALGVIAGDQVLMWLAVAGVAALLSAYPAAFHAAQWLGAVYLAWLGFRMLIAKAGAKPVLEIRPRHYVRQAFAKWNAPSWAYSPAPMICTTTGSGLATN